MQTATPILVAVTLPAATMPGFNQRSPPDGGVIDGNPVQTSEAPAGKAVATELGELPSSLLPGQTAAPPGVFLPPVSNLPLTAVAEKLPSLTASIVEAGSPPSTTASTVQTAQAPAHASALSSTAPPAAPLYRQLAPALIQVGHGMSANSVTLQLDPVGLGHVQVRIDQDARGGQVIQVTAERPETLRLLVADQPHLQSALDNAGLGDGRSLSFALATPAASVAGGGFGSTDGGGAGGRPGYGRTRRGGGASGDSDDDTTLAGEPSWLRIGVDITA